MTNSHAMPLVQLIDEARLEEADIVGDPGIGITGLSTHAQRCGRSHLFVATVGTRVDSHELISDAILQGASAILVERDIPPYPGVTTVRVPCTRRALGPLAQAFNGHPARRMRIAAVTGTNGKTSVAGILHGILVHAGMRAGRVGTLGAVWGPNRIGSVTTTPDALSLSEILARMVLDGVDTLAIEVSSHAIDQHRIGGLPVQVAALTNVSQDHLDYHGNFPTYIGVKRRLFFDYAAMTPQSVCCFNFDDPVGEELCASYELPFIKYGERKDPEGCDVTAQDVRVTPAGIRFTLVARGKSLPVASRLTGRFNVSNMLAAASMALGLGLDPDLVASGLSAAQPVEGRFENLDEEQPFTVLVDYAHTPDALEKLLRSVRQMTANRVIVVAGCGGDRDRAKRPLMGDAVATFADHAIVTSDNPRTEDPMKIAMGMLEGIRRNDMPIARHEVILDRAQAIERAIALATPGDSVVIAGKGHETYQEIGGTRYSFDDRVIARQILRSMADHWTEKPDAKSANQQTV